MEEKAVGDVTFQDPNPPALRIFAETDPYRLCLEHETLPWVVTPGRETVICRLCGTQWDDRTGEPVDVPSWWHRAATMRERVRRQEGPYVAHLLEYPDVVRRALIEVHKHGWLALGRDGWLQADIDAWLTAVDHPLMGIEGTPHMRFWALCWEADGR